LPLENEESENKIPENKESDNEMTSVLNQSTIVANEFEEQLIIEGVTTDKQQTYKQQNSKHEASEETHKGSSMHEQSVMVRPKSSVLPQLANKFSKGITKDAAGSTSQRYRELCM